MSSPAPVAKNAPASGHAPVPSPPRIAHPGVRAIAIAEGLKGMLALAGAGGLELLGPQALLRWFGALVDRFQWKSDGGFSGWLLQRLDADTVHIAAAVVTTYGVMRLVEAWGLWRSSTWASWFGCISAAIYIPFELYALTRDPDWITPLVLAINLVVVWVLARDLMRRSR